MKLKHGDILHCTRKSFLSWAIRKMTRSKFNHSALAIEIEGYLYIIDSQSDGTQLRPFDSWVKKYGYKYEVSRKKEAIPDYFTVRALSKSDTPYDFTSLLIRQPIYLITGKWRKKRNEAKRMYCSEFVAWCHEIPNSYILTPQDLYNYCLKSNKFI